MKFLCDNCKAKYQIADEKVAGKTVRMKCRKCGHQIEVRAAVTETGTSIAPKPTPPGTIKPAAPRTGLATSLSTQKPRAPSAAPGALAGAFSRNVSEAPSATEPAAGAVELSVTDEWYVAINGVPVGPVRISELRRKAAGGAVTEESLCWQEGLEEWRPIRSIPELATLVREAALGQRPSLVDVPPPAPARAPMAPAAPRPPTQRASTTPPPPRPLAPSAPAVGPGTGRSNVVPLRPAAITGPGIERASDDFGLGGGGAAAAFAATPEPAPFAPTPVPVPVGDPFAVPPPIAGAPLAPVDRASMLPVPSAMPAPPPPYETRKNGVPLWFWPVLLLALGFGGGLAVLVFRPQPPQAPVVIQMPPTAATGAAPTPSDKADVPPPPASGEAPPAATGGDTKKPGAIAAKGTPAPKATEEKKGIDLGNLVPGAGGPSVGPGTSPGATGGGLDQAGVERVVAGHRAGVKRTCWERGGADQKSSVNVTITANVAPNGTVASTSSSGDDPVVAKCIEGQVRNWSFPAPGSATTINIPFKFVRQ